MPKTPIKALDILAKQELGRALQNLHDVYDYLEVIAKNPLLEDVEYDLQQEKLLSSVGVILSLRVMRFLKGKVPQ